MAHETSRLLSLPEELIDMICKFYYSEPTPVYLQQTNADVKRPATDRPYELVSASPLELTCSTLYRIGNTRHNNSKELHIKLEDPRKDLARLPGELDKLPPAYLRQIKRLYLEWPVNPVFKVQASIPAAVWDNFFRRFTILTEIVIRGQYITTAEDLKDCKLTPGSPDVVKELLSSKHAQKFEAKQYYRFLPHITGLDNTNYVRFLGNMVWHPKITVITETIIDPNLLEDSPFSDSIMIRTAYTYYRKTIGRESTEIEVSGKVTTLQSVYKDLVPEKVGISDDGLDVINESWVSSFCARHTDSVMYGDLSDLQFMPVGTMDGSTSLSPLIPRRRCRGPDEEPVVYDRTGLLRTSSHGIARYSMQRPDLSHLIS